MIIDTHTHFYDPTRPQGVPWPPQDNELLYRTVLPEHALAEAQPHGVTGTVVVEASAWLEDNQWILDLAAAEPFLVGLVGHIDPNRAKFGSELERFAANPLFRGIRCHGTFFEDVATGTFLADMQTLADNDLALDVLVHPQHLNGLSVLAERVPDLRIVVDHIAHMPVDGHAVSPEWIERYRQLASHPNIFMKVSALMENSTVQPAPTDVDFYRPVLDALWHAFGADRVIYGSNWPVCERAGRYATCIGIVKTYFGEKGDAAADKYFQGNARAVYKWIER